MSCAGFSGSPLMRQVLRMNGQPSEMATQEWAMGLEKKRTALHEAERRLRKTSLEFNGVKVIAR